eukprot:scaffold32423_cov140-Isochrysis_galbana.AAC.1
MGSRAHHGQHLKHRQVAGLSRDVQGLPELHVAQLPQLRVQLQQLQHALAIARRGEGKRSLGHVARDGGGPAGGLRPAAGDLWPAAPTGPARTLAQRRRPGRAG